MNPSAQIACLLMVAAITRPASAATLDAAGLMQRNYEVSRVADWRAQTLFRLVGSNGKMREQYATTMARRGENGGMARIARFDTPADVKGTAVLTVEQPRGDDDIWVFLPALGNVRRLQASNKREAYMGTDLSYGDVIGHAPQDWTHRIIGRQIQDGVPCWLVESLPQTPAVAAASGYGRRVNWLRMDNAMMVRAELFDPAATLAKTITQGQITQVAPDRWQAMRITVENARTRHRTEVFITNYEANKGLKPDLFLPRALERAR